MERYEPPKLEKEMLAFWDANQIQQKARARNAGKRKKFRFIDGPITANNPMGVHHAWGRFYKDLWHRYKNMQGCGTRWQNGFDSQGLWVEREVEKERGFKGKADIEAFGILNFANACRERVMKFSKIQEGQSVRLGMWMDWPNSYYTMSDTNNEYNWHFLKTCHKKRWLYKGKDVMPWCPHCGTAVSKHDILTEGYRELTHPSIYMRFPAYWKAE